MKKLILLTLTLLVAMALFACKPSNTVGTPEYSEKTMLLLSDGTTTSVQIIRSDILNTQSNEVRCAVDLMNGIKEKAGVDVTIGTDYSGAYNVSEGANHSYWW